MTTYTEAVDQIFGIFNSDWEAGSASIVGYVPEIRWPGVEEPTKPDLTKYWARVSQQTVDDTQTGLRNGSCGQRYTASGLVFIQIF